MKITALVLDCDGVLTDGTCYYGEDGSTLLRFSRVDGHGVAKLRAAGVAVHVVTRSEDEAIARRCHDLRITAHLGVTDKLTFVRDTLRLDLSTTAAVGDDEPDLPLLRACARGYTPRGSWLVDEHLWPETDMLDHRGGAGAVREACEDILYNDGEEE